MIDRLFTAALAFTLLIGATFAIASAWFESRSTQLVTHLPAVHVVVARSNTHVASADSAAAPTSIRAVRAN